MPFTANRAFKQAPRLLARAEGMHYWDVDGHRILDGTSGLWCVNAGHARPPIVAAIQQAASTLDYAPGFNMGHPAQFELAERLTSIARKMRPGFQSLEEVRFVLYEPDVYAAFAEALACPA